MIEALRYKLRCFGISVEGPSEIFCDNVSVVKNSSIPPSFLNKRHKAIYYHRVRGDNTRGVKTDRFVYKDKNAWEYKL